MLRKKAVSSFWTLWFIINFLTENCTLFSRRHHRGYLSTYVFMPRNNPFEPIREVSKFQSHFPPKKKFGETGLLLFSLARQNRYESKIIYFLRKIKKPKIGVIRWSFDACRIFLEFKHSKITKSNHKNTFFFYLYKLLWENFFDWHVVTPSYSRF